MPRRSNPSRAGVCLGGILFGVACGPAIVAENSGGSQTSTVGSSSSTSEEDETSSTAQPGSSTSTTSSVSQADESSDGTTAALQACGDGQLDDDEACDDGNLVDADGCSQHCKVSGTPSWALLLEPAAASIEAMDVRDGDAYVLTASFEQARGHLTRVSRDGTLVFDAEDPSWNSEPSYACMTTSPDGGAVLSGGLGSHFTRLGSDAELLWQQPLGEWDYCRDVRWMDEILLSLHRPPNATPAQLLHFAAEGDALKRLGDSVVVPGFPFLGFTATLEPAGLFVRGDERVAVLVWTLESNEVVLHSGVDILSTPTWTSTPWPFDPGTAPRAFPHGRDIVVWTETERTRIDAQDVPQPPQPRAVPGYVVLSFSEGFLIRTKESVDAYTDDGELRWSHATAGAAQEAMLDGHGGVFVVSSTEYPSADVTLQHFVL